MKPQSTFPSKNQRIKADTSLQKKIGSGEISPALLKRCEETMKREAQKIDYKHDGLTLLKKLETTLQDLKTQKIQPQTAKDSLVDIIMQIKAGAGTFGYDLASQLAGITLSFLEAVQSLDKNVIHILKAHHTTLSIIFKNGMKGDGDKTGEKLQQELKSACHRYFNTHQQK